MLMSFYSFEDLTPSVENVIEQARERSSQLSGFDWVKSYIWSVSLYYGLCAYGQAKQQIQYVNF